MPSISLLKRVPSNAFGLSAIITTHRSKDCSHADAIRRLTPRWLKIIHKMWLDRQPYNPELHHRNQLQTRLLDLPPPASPTLVLLMKKPLQTDRTSPLRVSYRTIFLTSSFTSPWDFSADSNIVTYRLGPRKCLGLKNNLVNIPERTTAAVFSLYAPGQFVSDSASLKWPGLYVRRYRSPRIVDTFLVPATPEPLISCVVRGSAELQERELGEAWVTRQIQPGDIFVTRSKTPYELRSRSPIGRELDFILIHLAVDQYLAALEAVYPGRTEEVEVVDFFGRDEALAHLCYVCAEMLSAEVPGKSRRITALTQLLAAHLVEKYTHPASQKVEFHGGLPIRQLRKVEDYVRERLTEDIPVEALAELVELSPFHFSRVFKQVTGMSPLQFVKRERIARAQQLVRETSRSLIEIALEVGYRSPSHFARVFRRVVGVTPTEFRNAL